MKLTKILEISEREVFILRVWKSIEQNAQLMGQIQHVRSGKTFPVREPEGMLQFIQKQMDADNEKKSIPPGIK